MNNNLSHIISETVSQVEERILGELNSLIANGVLEWERYELRLAETMPSGKISLVYSGRLTVKDTQEEALTKIEEALHSYKKTRVK